MPIVKVQLLSWFYKWKNEDLGRVNNLLKVMQLISKLGLCFISLRYPYPYNHQAASHPLRSHPHPNLLQDLGLAPWLALTVFLWAWVLQLSLS